MCEQLQGNPFAGLLGGVVPVDLPGAGRVVVHRGGAVRKSERRKAVRRKTAKDLASQAAYRARNRERLAAYARAYYERHRERLLAQARKVRAEQAERERARLKAYYALNREKVLAKAAARRMAKKAAAVAAAQKGVGHV